MNVDLSQFNEKELFKDNYHTYATWLVTKILRSYWSYSDDPFYFPRKRNCQHAIYTDGITIFPATRIRPLHYIKERLEQFEELDSFKIREIIEVIEREFIDKLVEHVYNKIKVRNVWEDNLKRVKYKNTILEEIGRKIL